MIRVLALAALLTTSAAFSEPLVEKRIVTGKTVIDPASGYIYLYGTGRQGGTFIRVPDADDNESYRNERDAAFEKAIERYGKQLKRWNADVKLAQQMKKAAPEKPVEPTQENFSIGDIERRTAIQFGPDYAYIKDKSIDRFGYAMSVKPGTYIWYGPIVFDIKQGFIGVCYCMGSVKFEVKPGVVTNLGNFLLAAPLAEQQKGAPLLDIRHSGGWNGFKVEVPITSAAVSFDLPGSLSQWPSVTPDFVASGKLNNFYGVMISRLPPVPGILEYQRDKIIDARSGNTVKNGT